MRAVHKSELAIGKTKGVSLMLEELKNCSDPKKCFDPNVFLKSLRLDSLLPRIEVDMCFYITNRAQLEVDSILLTVCTDADTYKG